MTTLKITVDNRKNDHLLTKLLKSMAFVKNIEEVLTVSAYNDQFAVLQKIFNSKKIASPDTKLLILVIT